MESTLRLLIEQADIDNYGHLNNARYALYFEEGRLNLVEKASLAESSLREDGIGFQVRRASYEYIRSVDAGQEVEITSWLDQRRKSTVLIRQSMTLDGKTVATAVAEYFFRNLNSGRPVRPPKVILDLI